MKKLLIASVLLASVVVVGSMAFAETENSNSPRPSSSPSIHRENKDTKKVIDVACMSTAIGKRDAAIIAARDAQHNAIVAAITARTLALKAAWALTDVKARRIALKNAWQDYNTAARGANKAYNTARKMAWKAFQLDAKACGGSNEESMGSGADAQ